MKMRILAFLVAASLAAGASRVSAAITDVAIPDDQSKMDAIVEENLALKETVKRLEDKVAILQTLLQNSSQLRGEKEPAGPVAVGDTGAPRESSQPRNEKMPLPSRGDRRIGVDGYDPVVLVEEQRWTMGDRKFGAVHRGVTYLFASDQTQKRFLADPERFAPACDGCDPIDLEQGTLSAGHREHGAFFDNHIYLFANEANLNRFASHPIRFADLKSQAESLASNSKEAPRNETPQVVSGVAKQAGVIYSGARARRHFRR